MQSNGRNQRPRFENYHSKKVAVRRAVIRELVRAMKSYEIVRQLWGGLLWVDGGGGGIDFEIEEPLAWDVAAVQLSGDKFPEFRGC
jgi:hypothetical protein